MNPESYDDIVTRIYEADNRFDPEAYYYLRDVIDRTTQKLERSGPTSKDRHVSGQELSEGFRDCMLEDFGPMAATLAEEWGIGQSEDIGSMVYNLIEAGAFGKSSKDKKSDFNGVFNLLEVLETPYRPKDLHGFLDMRECLRELDKEAACEAFKKAKKAAARTKKNKNEDEP